MLHTKFGPSRKPFFMPKALAIFFKLAYSSFCAEVVELVDTLGSGSSARKGMGVRVSPSAPFASFLQFIKARKANSYAGFSYVLCS